MNAPIVAAARKEGAVAGEAGHRVGAKGHIPQADRRAASTAAEQPAGLVVVEGQDLLVLLPMCFLDAVVEHAELPAGGRLEIPEADAAVVAGADQLAIHRLLLVWHLFHLLGLPQHRRGLHHVRETDDAVRVATQNVSIAAIRYPESNAAVLMARRDERLVGQAQDALDFRAGNGPGEGGRSAHERDSYDGVGVADHGATPGVRLDDPRADLGGARLEGEEHVGPPSHGLQGPKEGCSLVPQAPLDELLLEHLALSEERPGFHEALRVDGHQELQLPLRSHPAHAGEGQRTGERALCGAGEAQERRPRHALEDTDGAVRAPRDDEIVLRHHLQLEHPQDVRAHPAAHGLDGPARLLLVPHFPRSGGVGRRAVGARKWPVLAADGRPDGGWDPLLAPLESHGGEPGLAHANAPHGHVEGVHEHFPPRLGAPDLDEAVVADGHDGVLTAVSQLRDGGRVVHQRLDALLRPGGVDVPDLDGARRPLGELLLPLAVSSARAPNRDGLVLALVHHGRDTALVPHGRCAEDLVSALKAQHVLAPAEDPKGAELAGPSAEKQHLGLFVGVHHEGGARVGILLRRSHGGQRAHIGVPRGHPKLAMQLDIHGGAPPPLLDSGARGSTWPLGAKESSAFRRSGPRSVSPRTCTCGRAWDSVKAAWATVSGFCRSSC
eukprot:scaffold908_cov228-Pinguiococcus_pyrenoidosus.AAC.2